MGATLNSFDSLIAAARTKGIWKRAIADKIAATTAADANSGHVSAQRFPTPISLPASFGAGVTGALFTLVDVVTGMGNCIVAGLEYTLGTLTVSTNVFAAGVTMPSKFIIDSSIQTATLLPMLVATATLTATTPVVTITYTNQSGVGSRTATLTLPTNVLVNSAFCIAPHLQSGDTGIRAVTNISISAGSAGTLKVMGLLPIGETASQTTQALSIDPLAWPMPMFPADVSDVVAFYSFGANVGAGDLHAFLAAVADY